MPAVSRETQYNPPVNTEAVLEQAAPVQGGDYSSRPPSRGLPEYPRENPLFADEDEEDAQQVHDMVLLPLPGQTACIVANSCDTAPSLLTLQGLLLEELPHWVSRV